MIVYHRTDAADEILGDGFGDGSGSYLIMNTYTGVWVSDSPLSVNEGAIGDQVLAVDLPD